MHLLLVLGFQLTESGAFTLIECRGLSLCGRTILQRLEVTLSLAHRLRLSLEARLIALHFHIEQLLLRKNVGDSTVFGTTAPSEEEMLEPVHQTVQWLDFDVQGVLRCFLRNVVTIEDFVIWVQLHDRKQCP
jgi:hypothetical protein